MPFFTNCAMIIPHCQYEGKPQDLSLLAPTKRILISLRTFASSVDQDIRRNTRRTKNKRPSAKATPLRNGLSSIDECRGAHASTSIAFRSTSCGVVTTASRVSLPRKITTATCIGWAAECALRAFVLMTNHVHLFVTTSRCQRQGSVTYAGNSATPKPATADGTSPDRGCGRVEDR